MTKYREYFERMLAANKELFENFRKLHEKYSLRPEETQEEFNKEGEKVLAIVREWEDKLCRQSEKAGYATFTSSLAEKFQSEVKKAFPLIDHVGLIVKKFQLKKINLT